MVMTKSIIKRIYLNRPKNFFNKRSMKSNKIKSQIPISSMNMRRSYNNWHKSVTSKWLTMKHCKLRFFMPRLTSLIMKSRLRRILMGFPRLTTNWSNKDKSTQVYKEILNFKTSLMVSSNLPSNKWRWSKSNRRSKRIWMSKMRPKSSSKPKMH